MKKLILLFFAGLLISGISVGQYTIKGDLGKGDAQISLLKGKEVLAETAMKEGKFVFKGKVEVPTSVKLVLDRNTQVLVFLENKANYKVSVNPEDSSLTVTGGGKFQQLHREYENVLKENNQKQAEILALARKADREGKWMDVSHYKALLYNLDRSRNNIENDFIKKHQASPYVSYYAYRGMNDLEYDELKAKYELLGKAARESDFGKAVAERLERLRKTSAGSIAPDFTLDTPDGTPVILHDVKGKVKIIDFWASWCGPCRAKNPFMLELYKKYKDAGLNIISVSLDAKKEAWEKAVEADSLPWTQVSSLKGWKCPVAAEYGVSGIPHLVVLDENNRIIVVEPYDSDLKKLLDERLK